VQCRGICARCTLERCEEKSVFTELFDKKSVFLSCLTKRACF
jgi:hypothetical protein